MIDRQQKLKAIHLRNQPAVSESFSENDRQSDMSPGWQAQLSGAGVNWSPRTPLDKDGGERGVVGIRRKSYVARVSLGAR